LKDICWTPAGAGVSGEGGATESESISQSPLSSQSRADKLEQTENCVKHTARSSYDPEPLPALGRLRQLLQLSLRQFSVGDDGGQMIAHLADDVDGQEELFAADGIVDRARAPGGGVAVFELRERLAEQIVLPRYLFLEALSEADVKLKLR
jgi:hypothetical protein